MEPSKLYIRYPGNFDIQRADGANVSDAEWLQKEQFEKKGCMERPVGINFIGREIEHRSSNGTQISMQCYLQNDKSVCLALEPHGISVRIETGNGSDLFPCPGIQKEPVDSFAMRVTCYSSEDTSSMALPTPAQSHLTVVPPTSPTPPRTPSDLVIKDAIKKNFTFLLKNFVVTPFVNYLYESDMITLDEMEKAHKEPNSAVAARYVLIDILSKRPVSKKSIERALHETKQGFCLKHFFQIRKNN